LYVKHLDSYPSRDKTEIRKIQIILDCSESGWWSSSVDMWSLDCCRSDNGGGPNTVNSQQYV